MFSFVILSGIALNNRTISICSTSEDSETITKLLRNLLILLVSKGFKSISISLLSFDLLLMILNDFEGALRYLFFMVSEALY